MLTDLLPAKHRRRIYALVTLAAVVFGAWQASDGNWTTFTASVLTALTTGMATANTQPPRTGEEGVFTLADACLVVIAGVLLLGWLGIHGHVG